LKIHEFCCEAVGTEKKAKYLLVDLRLMVAPSASKCILDSSITQCATQSFAESQSTVMKTPDAYVH